MSMLPQEESGGVVPVRSVRLLLAGLVVLLVAVAALLVMLIVMVTDDSQSSEGASDEGEAVADFSGVGEPASDTADGATNSREGVVHVHEDGFVHTHGAGQPVSWTVTYTSEGKFVPERLEILTGDEVVFVNESDIPVWPASNIHPTHEILSSFDPLGVIQPGQSWSYNFNENGFWRYHNHIAPSEVGLVVSTGGPEAQLEPLDMAIEDFRFDLPPPGVGDEQLMDDPESLERFVIDYGPSAAVTELKSVEVSTGRDCHNAAHEVGHIAYENFGAAAFVLAGHDCHAGALHGTIESLFSERGTAKLSEDVAVICSTAENSFFVHQCMHGVGHGLMAWTTYELHESLELCDLMPTSINQRSCYSGVFMENGVGGLSGLMGHTTEYLDQDDLHFPCNVVGDRYVTDCYFYQTSNMFDFGVDSQTVAAACNDAPVKSQQSCFQSMGRDVGSVFRSEPSAAVSACRYSETATNRSDCFKGAALSRFTEPENAGFAIELCSLVDTEEGATAADGCWDVVLRNARHVLPTAEDKQSFCDNIPIEVRREDCHSEVAA